MANVFEQIADWISDLFEGIWDFIQTYLPYILLACALFVLCVAPISLAWLGIAGAIEGAWGAAFLAGASFLIFPDETARIVVRSVDQIGAVAEEVVDEVVDTADAAVTGILSSSSLWLILGAAALFFLLTSKDDDDEKRPKQQVTPRQSRPDGRTAQITSARSPAPVTDAVTVRSGALPTS